MHYYTKIICLLVIVNVTTFPLKAQLFVSAGGAINGDISDSRSVNFIDLNNDGWQDLFISNGLQGGQKDLLYLNNGSGILNAVRDMDIVLASNPADGASFADYNNDGHLDGVVSSWYGKEDLLYLNDGQGNLSYNADAGMAPGSFAEAASFGDYDGDGLLDLYITNSATAGKNFLYKNLGNGKFERQLDHILVQEAKPSRGVIWGDFNNDGITDLYVANESANPNDLYLGLGNGNYEKFIRGSIVVKANGTMTGSWGDVDNDGDFDLFVGNSGFFTGENNQLIKNFGGSFGEDPASIIRDPRECTFGSAFGDYDNDGDLDLIITNGFCANGLANRLYENQGDGAFKDVSNLLPNNGNTCSFGVAWGDVNNDGFLDLAIANCKNNEEDTQKRNDLLLNQGNDNNWIQLKLVGIQSNRDAIGARIRVKTSSEGGSLWQTREIRTQSGYAGQNSIVAHFGLAKAEQVDSVVILWPAGTVQVLKELAINQILTVQEGIVSKVKASNAFSALQLSLFPNPIAASKDSLKINIDSPKRFRQVQLQLFNVQGQLVWEEQVEIQTGANTFKFNLAQRPLSAGLYHLNLLSNQGQIGKKLILK